MTKRRRQDLLDSITNCATTLEKEAVLDVMRLHNIEDIDNLSTAELEVFFSDLFQRQVDSID